jgi:hypothetical protein
VLFMERECRVFVGGVNHYDRSAGVRDLRRLLRTAGTVTDCVFYGWGAARCWYASKAAAQRAVAELTGEHFAGEKIWLVVDDDDD